MSVTDYKNKCLIMFYASSNHAMRVNWERHCERLKNFCSNPENRYELVDELRQMANSIERAGEK